MSEPRFKVGDWVIPDMPDCLACANAPFMRVVERRSRAGEGEEHFLYGCSAYTFDGDLVRLLTPEFVLRELELRKLDGSKLAEIFEKAASKKKEEGN